MIYSPFFSISYFCESAFSHMKIIKSKYNFTMSDDLVKNLLVVGYQLSLFELYNSGRFRSVQGTSGG